MGVKKIRFPDTSAIGIKPTLVPFTGTAPVMNAILAGNVDYDCDPVLGPLQHVRAGTVKALAIVHFSDLVAALEALQEILALQPAAIEAFRDYLNSRGVTATVRRTRGDDIDAACGQLAGQVHDRTTVRLGSKLIAVEVEA